MKITKIGSLIDPPTLWVGSCKKCRCEVEVDTKECQFNPIETGNDPAGYWSVKCPTEGCGEQIEVFEAFLPQIRRVYKTNTTSEQVVRIVSSEHSTIKIVEEGVLPNQNPLKGECHDCGCKIEVNKEMCKLVRYDYGGDYGANWEIKCPTAGCSVTIRIPKKGDDGVCLPFFLEWFFRRRE